MKIVETSIPGVQIIEPKIFRDARGFFFETYSEERYVALGVRWRFVQDNYACSHAGVLRGLHYQVEDRQAKLVSVLRGRIFDVAVDIRRGSPHFLQHVEVELSAENQRQLLIPAGFAHGYYAIEDSDFIYKCSRPFRPEHERGIAYNDSDLAISWPLGDQTPFLSPRDAALPTVANMPKEDLPPFETP
ncbi:MAG: dTDP-4-dehydrorhamnose 3,5-epimerase [Deltaproteobacteria bacterium]|nr:dTDP-4-dehydrorhamnose 3,5-epimerase [Deltaproteobacteria bacterium]